MNKLIRVGLALVIVALSAFFSYKGSHSSSNTASHEKTKSVAVAQEAMPQTTRTAEAALPASNSPIDFKHIIGADYKRHTGEPTGGHTLLHGDVRVIDGTESPSL